MKKYASIFLLVILCSAPLFSVFVTPVQAAKEIYVDSAHWGFSDGSAEKPYTSIQKAIDVASKGDTIYVFGGTYDETLIISKELNLWGSIDGIPSIIDAHEDKRYTVTITVSYVKFEGFTLQDAKNHKSSPIGALIGIQADNVNVIGNHLNDTKSYGIYLDGTGDGSLIVGNSINNTNHGIHIANSDTVDVIRNNISNCTTYGIYISGSMNSRLYDNVIETCLTGVAVVSSTSINVTNNTIKTSIYAGLQIEDSTGSIVKLNTFDNNTGSAFYLAASNTQVYDNLFKENERGITITGFSSIIRNNTFFNNTASGIYALSGSDENTLYTNHFIENGKSAEDLGDNWWYYQQQGNYWSDYGGIDRALDGIGDNPYVKYGIVDDFPLGYFLKPPNKPSEPSPEDAETSVGLKITFDVAVEDEDSDQMTVYFYKYIQNGTDVLIGTDKHVSNGSIASCRYVQPFDTTFLWYAIANDSILENRSDIWYFTTMATPPDNKPPVAHPGGPYNAKPEQIVTLDASKSTDPDGVIEFYRWNFGDGSSEILAKRPTHVYNTIGNYILTLTVIDDNGTSDTENTTVTIAGNPNIEPIAHANGPYTAKTTELITLTAVNSSDVDGNLINYTWNFGDGTLGYGEYVMHGYEGEGSYLVILTVTDDAGGSSSAQTTATVTEPKSGLPGFEMIVLVVAGMLIIILKRRLKT